MIRIPFLVIAPCDTAGTHLQCSNFIAARLGSPLEVYDAMLAATLEVAKQLAGPLPSARSRELLYLPFKKKATLFRHQRYFVCVLSGTGGLL